MLSEAMQFAVVLERIGRDVLAQLSGISNTDLNRPLPLPETNSLFALATHLVGAGEFWVLVLVGEQTIPRDRAAEFYATGALPDLVTRYERWMTAVHQVLDPLPDAKMGQIVGPPVVYRYSSDDGPTRVRDALLHAVEHSALHLGHIQITRQMLGYDPPS